MIALMQFLKWAVIIIIALPALIFWFLMLMDCIFRDFGPYAHKNNKFLWILVMVLMNAVGAAVYYFWVKRPAGKSDFGSQRDIN